jgi:hypothetical protein
MRKRFIQHPETLELIPVEDYYYQPQTQSTIIMADIQPYKSMIDGSMITSRSQHRAHLKAHNCIEVGNETKYLKNKFQPLSGLKSEIIRQVNEKLR